MQKRTIQIFFLLFLFYFSLQAQDKIILRKGGAINGYITQITKAIITFNSWEKTDSICQISILEVERIIYAEVGSNGLIQKATVPDKENAIHTSTDEVIVRGNSYFYKGVRRRHNELGLIYKPLHDTKLNDMYSGGMNMRRSSMALKIAPIPIGAIGYIVVLFSLFPTNLNADNREKLNYGNDNLLVPGLLIMGSAILCGIGGIISHKCYKKQLRKSADRYNLLIRNQ